MAVGENIKVGSDLQYAKGFAITPHDSTDFAIQTQAVFVGGAGNAVVVWEDGTTSTLTGLLAGHIYRLKLRRINSTSTTATALVGLY